LGSVVAIASTSAVLDQITYDPFGNIATQTNATDAVRFGFAGMEYDSTTGLYYDHARYYDAAIGRFVEQDPMGFAAGDTNLYRYVGNEPTAVADVSGEQPPITPHRVGFPDFELGGPGEEGPGVVTSNPIANPARFPMPGQTTETTSIPTGRRTGWLGLRRERFYYTYTYYYDAHRQIYVQQFIHGYIR
jgi:RHS repeat-associated protein